MQPLNVVGDAFQIGMLLIGEGAEWGGGRLCCDVEFRMVWGAVG
jgi:hypothetical protein